MKFGDFIIIDERENSGWVDSWTEYLCLEELSEEFELTIRSNEILAEAMEYVDEEGEELELPEKINGEFVHCRDGDFILGENLVIRPGINGGSIKFKDAHEENVKNWLQSLRWFEDEIFSEIEEATKK